MVRLCRLVALLGGLAASTATLEDWQQRFQTVGFEINPLKVLNGESLLARGLHRSVSLGRTPPLPCGLLGIGRRNPL
eukprot:20028-Eustigmatos_ZCMA.PRE.1